MALDYKQSDQLRTNLIFRGRIASAALKFSASILSNNAIDITQTVKRQEVNYAEETFKNPASQATALQPAVVQDPAVQGASLDAEGNSTISDAALQSAVEIAIHKIL